MSKRVRETKLMSPGNQGGGNKKAGLPPIPLTVRSNISYSVRGYPKTLDFMNSLEPIEVIIPDTTLSVMYVVNHDQISYSNLAQETQTPSGELITTVNKIVSPINADNLRKVHTDIEEGQAIGKYVLEGWT